MSSLSEFDLRKDLPPSLTNDDTVMALAQLFTVEVLDLLPHVNRLTILPHLGEMPDAVLDVLAEQMHVDFYEQTMPRDTKVSLIYSSIAWHRRKGTIGIVEDMVKTISSYAEVVENWDYGGNPYRFRIEIETNDTYDVNDISRVVTAVKSVKNVRSRLDSVDFRRTSVASVYMSGAPVYTTMEVDPILRTTTRTNAPMPMPMHGNVVYTSVKRKEIN